MNKNGYHQPYLLLICTNSKSKNIVMSKDLSKTLEKERPSLTVLFVYIVEFL